MGILVRFFCLSPVLLLLYPDFYLFDSYSYRVVIFFSGILLGIPPMLLMSPRIKSSFTAIALCLSFLVLVGCFSLATSLIQIFVCYELFLLPSFYLVYTLSPNRRSTLAGIYFLIWTQVGSFLVAIATLLVLVGAHNNHSSLLFALVFIGFGVKIPCWPFHFWLTKTHVEAPTYFSIYLSGFLVKTALFGLWFFITTLGLSIPWWSIIMAVLGVLDSSLKMFVQVDLKKLVAYATIQEMNLILLSLLSSSSAVLVIPISFILTHTILSTIFFLLSDLVYKRFASRVTLTVFGLMQLNPRLSYIIFSLCVMFAGIPFTLKFIVEIFTFSQLYVLDVFTLSIVLAIANVVGLCGFSLNWFRVLFGLTFKNVNVLLSSKELSVLGACAVLLIVFPFVMFI